MNFRNAGVPEVGKFKFPDSRVREAGKFRNGEVRKLGGPEQGEIQRSGSWGVGELRKLKLLKFRCSAIWGGWEVADLELPNFWGPGSWAVAKCASPNSEVREVGKVGSLTPQIPGLRKLGS